MKHMARTLGFLVATCAGLGGAVAQTTTATSPAPSPGVSETVPQAPSGGTTGAGGAAGPGKSVLGEQTDAERKAQKDSDKVQQICKGC